MKPFSTLRLSIGLFLMTGCTFNQQTTNNHTSVYAPTAVYTSTVVEAEDEKESGNNAPPAQAPQPQKQCAPYKPLQIKPPVQIDLDLIRKARNGDEINLILRTNIGALNEQIKNFSAAQESHYRAWLKRCARQG